VKVLRGKIRAQIRTMAPYGSVLHQGVFQKDLLASWRPPISGSDIMETLGLTEGKMVGIIKSRMENAIIDGLIPYEREAALTYIRKVYEELNG